MKQTFQQLKKQIEALEAKAAVARKNEVSEVVRRIKTAIDAYGLTAFDLFDPKPHTALSQKAGRAATHATGDQPKYADGKGNTWVGRGKRPGWLQAALASGASLQHFATSAQSAASPDADNASSVKKGTMRTGSQKKRTAPVRYRDGAGNTWSGRGSTPRWLREAIATGKSREDFAI